MNCNNYASYFLRHFSAFIDRSSTDVYRKVTPSPPNLSLLRKMALSDQMS